MSSRGAACYRASGAPERADSLSARPAVCQRTINTPRTRSRFFMCGLVFSDELSLACDEAIALYSCRLFLFLTRSEPALLQQCINHVRGEARQFKKKIEEHFDEIKTITEASSTPELPLDKRQWLKGLTKNIKETVGQFPPQISQHLAPTTAALRKSRGITGMGVSAGASGAAEGWWGSAAAAGAGKGGPASSAVAAAPVAAKGGAAGGYYYGTAGGYQQQQGGWR